MNIKDYYSRKDVKAILVKYAKSREIAINFGERGFGKRPDILQYEEDIAELAKQGATSFHFSEEHWKNPLLLSTKMSKRDLNELRVGWDLLIDIDGKNLDYSSEAARLILDVLNFYNIKNVLLKYSGNRGWHLMVPFSSFPDKINEIEIKDFFPDGLKIIVNFIKFKIKDFLKEKLNNNEPFSLVDVDTGLISSRHMFRAPYSINEKSGLASIIVRNIEKFSKEDAKMENVKVIDIHFENRPGEARGLIMQALDWDNKQRRNEDREENKIGRRFIMPENGIMAEYWPPCVNLMMKGMDDGRKRTLFILYNFFRSIGYSANEVEIIILEWNKKNKEKLIENYVRGQLDWFKKNKDVRLPPNCLNQNYMVGIEVCKPDNFCSKIKNPANYSLLKKRMMEEQKTKKRAKKAK